ncbi:unnamed protein product [Adineta steineri]|uniref:Apple domain-containing protein n=1 Tax=Adineta steineri TaxID=433720 RepID=A0A819D050_9BILA|nr:unnamed protein product [Adineta steineri]CAF3829837.1 unnamed protein product [Adineta steineri]
MILIGILIINILSVSLVKCSINWNGNNWAHNCNFKENDLSNVRVRAEQCGGKCAATPGCTHFTWTNYKRGTCWMKKGSISKSDAFESHGRNKICGVVQNEGGHGINWNGNNWAHNCDFKENDLSNVQVRAEQCGGKCAATPGCTHFTWTNYNDGTCWMKKGSVSKTDAILTEDRSMVCGVLGNNAVEGGGGSSNSSGNIVNEQTFACVFNTIDAGTRASRFNGLQESGWKPANKDEAAVFLAHVFHESDGLKAMEEYCAPACASNYAGSWCEIQGKPGKLYYGRGWFQLSWPCNYYAAGKALDVDLLNNPDAVAQQPSLAVQTAVWFYRTNKMEEPARRGDFAATTDIINGKLECNGGSNAANQRLRVDTYKRVRQCFGLGEPTINVWC